MHSTYSSQDQDENKTKSLSSATTSLLPKHHDDEGEDDVIAHDFPLIEWSDDAENDTGVEDGEDEQEEETSSSSKKRQSNEDLFSMMCSPSTKRRRRRRSTSAPVDLNQIHTKLKVNMKRQNPDGSLLRSLKFACKLDSLATLNEGNNPSWPTTAAAASSSWTSSAFASHFDHHELLDNSGSSSSKNMQNYQWPSISTMSACTTSLPISSPSSVDLFKALEKIENLTISYNDDFVQA